MMRVIKVTVCVLLVSSALTACSLIKSVYPSKPAPIAAATTTPEVTATPAVAPIPPPSRAQRVEAARDNSENLYELGVSNYDQVFEEFDDVESITVVFANDSLRIGESGKSRISQLLSNYDHDTDVVSVVGCSHGYTAIRDGNRRLAAGRAKRVTEALINAGVQREKVLDEGCWATTPFDEVFPRRGVVLTLKREKNTG